MTTIKLQCSDDRIVETDEQIAKCSVLIREVLEITVKGDDAPIDLPKVNSKILKKILEWVKHHKNDPQPTEDDKSKIITPWDKDFLRVDQGTLIDLISAANYLDIKELLELTCKHVANMIKGKTPEEIRKILNINKKEMFRRENELE